MQQVPAVIAVAIGAALGGVLRYAVGSIALQRFGPGFPWGTLFINVTGSFCIGVIAQLSETRALGVTPFVRIFLATGVVGGYTTFSTFSLDSVTLLGDNLFPAVVYVGASTGCGLVAAALGLLLTRLALG